MFKLKITFINSILHRNTRNMATKTAKIIDFRSDTLSLPTQEMREAIFKAVVGDDVFSEDSTTNALEAKCAKLVEKEAACYVTSGTMSNLLSVLAHCDERGSEIITGHLSHINLFEQRGVSQVVSSFGGVSVREIRNNEDGTFDISELASFVRSNRLHEPTTKLICVENTHNVLGGKVVPLDWINDLAKFAKSKNIKLHLDGARIFNAASKLNVPVSRIAKDFDSVTFCFSKGLGAPYGAIVMGSREFINRVRRTRKGIGGGVRQIGFMAAAGIHALDNLEHLKDDHAHTQMIADVIREANNPYITVPKAEDIHSNILMISVNTEKITSQELAKKLETVSQHDDDPVSIRTLTFGEDKLRIVLCCNNTHSNVLDANVKIKKILSEIM